MGMELKCTDDAQCVEIHDKSGKIGELRYAAPDPEDPTEGWYVDLGCFNGISYETGFFPTPAEAFAASWPLHEKLLAEQRRVNRCYRDRNVRMIGTPMGGQPKR
ncbi:hypothetical protein [Streptomyces sp. Da 82-17]|uniref:hypothetical protein n=1 Tax=Streptomyces sp. Da 82-17 TaxID=3377116 RepID=UPI0038D505BA